MYRIKSSQNYFSSENDYKPFPVTFLLTGDALENLAREVLKMLKLFTESDIGGYNRLFNADIVKHFMDELGEVKQTIAKAKAKKKLSLSLSISVQTEIIDKINKYLADPNAAPPKPVSEMNSEERFKEVIKRCLLLLPAEVGEQLKSLLSPWVITGVVVILIIWAGGHFTGASEIADVAILIIGGAFLGFAVFQAAELLVNFADKTINAKTEADLDQAADCLAKAISLIGIQTILALLLWKAPKVFNEPKVLMNQGRASVPLTMKTIGEPPITPGRIFYDAKVNPLKADFPQGPVTGMTNQWGEVTLFVTKNIKDVKATRAHEIVHKFLTPKLQMFPKIRQFRAVIKNQGYLRSYLLRYLEEALAETFAQLTVNGINYRNFMAGIRFPVGQAGEGCYVTSAALKIEAKGIFLGPISVGGMIFNVYFEYSK